MQEPVIIDIEYQGQLLTLEGWLQMWDYQHRIEIRIHSIPVIFEPDEKLDYHIALNNLHPFDTRLNPELLGLVARRLTYLFC